MPFDLDKTVYTLGRVDNLYNRAKKVAGIKTMADARRKAAYVKGRVSHYRRNLGSAKGLKKAVIRAAQIGNVKGLKSAASKLGRKELTKFYKA